MMIEFNKGKNLTKITGISWDDRQWKSSDDNISYVHITMDVLTGPSISLSYVK